MATTIWKTELHAGCNGALVPIGAVPLSVHLQDEKPVMWWKVDPDALCEVRELHIAGTGHPLPDNIGDFIGTFLVQNDSLVFHVFELS